MSPAPPPPPPPPPPPMPNFDLKNHREQTDYANTQQVVASSNLESELGIDLVSPSGCVKPHMKMRTLNWRRIPKRRVLSHHLERRKSQELQAATDSLSQMFHDMNIRRSPNNKDEADKTTATTTTTTTTTCPSLDSSDDEATNIWFKIAKSNNAVKRVEPKPTPPSTKINTPSTIGKGQSDISQDTITNSGGSQPVTSASGKSASRIREMLEAVRRRMVAVAAASSPAAESEIARTPTNGGGGGGSGGHNDSSYLFQAYNLESGKRPSILSPRPAKPKSVLEAMDFRDLESLFCLNTQPNPILDGDEGNFVRRSSWRSNNGGASSDSVISSNNSCDGFYLEHPHHQPHDSGHHSTTADSDGGGGDPDNRREDSMEFLSENILDSKKSLNVNIFLKQLKNQTQLIEQINEGNNKLIGEERLQSILKLLPDDQEQVQLMKFYTRNKQHRLPVAEKFLLQLLVRVPNLRLKIKFMLLKEKYYNDIDEHIPCELDKIDGAIRELRKSCKFRDLLNLVLVTGNFLNSGGYAADAAGFSLDCLNRLHEVRSNREGVYLIHYLAEIAHKMNLVEFQRDELTYIESASRVCLESIKLDLVSMSERIQELKCDIDNAPSGGGGDRKSVNKDNGGEEEFITNLLRTLEDIKCNVDFLKKKVTQDLEAKRKKLADYLCEDPVTFNLHDCFSCIQTFSRRLKTATEENERRLRLEMKKSSLKRSNTIHSRLPKQPAASISRRPIMTSGRKSLGGGESFKQPAATATYLEPAYFDKTRASFGGYISSERRQSFNSSKTHANSIPRTPLGPGGDIVRTSSTCSSIIKSSLSSLSSHNTSSFGNNSDCDDLHDGLMRLLNDSNSRRSSGPLRRASGRFIGQ